MSTTPTHATPKKLRDGSWGAIAQGESIKAGDQIHITTRSGKSWDAVVEKVIWSGNGVSICATNSRSTRTRSCRRCGCTDPTCGGAGGGICRGPDFNPCFDCEG